MFEYFISLTALSFHRELQLINYQDLTQDTLLIWLDLSMMKIIHNGKTMLILESILYVVAWTDSSRRKFKTLGTNVVKQSEIVESFDFLIWVVSFLMKKNSLVFRVPGFLGLNFR